MKHDTLHDCLVVAAIVGALILGLLFLRPPKHSRPQSATRLAPTTTQAAPLILPGDPIPLEDVPDMTDEDWRKVQEAMK